MCRVKETPTSNAKRSPLVKDVKDIRNDKKCNVFIQRIIKIITKCTNVPTYPGFALISYTFIGLIEITVIDRCADFGRQALEENSILLKLFFSIYCMHGSTKNLKFYCLMSYELCDVRSNTQLFLWTN
jgi:hypothetical protein